METVTFDGVSYVKASVVAKQFRYTTDYIGQLCRAKKVDARLVGRTWFVNPDSIIAHKKSRHQKKVVVSAVSKAVLENENNEADTPVTSVVPVFKKQIAPTLTAVARKQVVDKQDKAVIEKHLTVFYEPDEEKLLPTLHRKEHQPPRLLKIEPAGAKKMRITSEKTSIAFAAEALPEVALSGALAVTTYEEPAEPKKEVNEPKKSTAEHRATARPVVQAETKSTTNKYMAAPVTPKVVAMTKQVAKQSSVFESLAVDQSVPLQEKTASTQLTKSVAATKEVTASFTPVAVRQRQQYKSPLLVSVSPLIATCIAVLCVGFIFASSTSIVASDTGYDSEIVLQVANALELLKQKAF